MAHHETDLPPLAPLLKGTNLYLIGMMGSGKTTIAQRLAKQLGYQFFDTDALIEQVAGDSITNIFANSGEAAFRDLETQVLSEICAYTKLAIATGGGIVVRPKNWSFLHHGITIWLDVPVDELYHRIRGSTQRPLLQTPDPKAQLQALLDQRQALYAQADIRVEVAPTDSPDQVVQTVLESVRKALRPPSQPPDSSV